jgi:1-acyl-sn-glycerol-3-phosphate acyltransferase
MLIKSVLFDVAFRLSGWKLVGRVPYDLPKSLIIVCPHATWKDFPIGLGARSMMNMPINFWGKKELFDGFLGGVFSWLGGYPVDRSKNNNLVGAIVDIYHSKSSFHAVLAPEGTRKDVDALKTGFYYIAVQAQVPIVMIGFDYVNKQIKIREPFIPSGDFEVDKLIIADYYQSIPGVQKSWIKNYLADRV